jgi:hypothetical protein
VRKAGKTEGLGDREIRTDRKRRNDETEMKKGEKGERNT